MLLELYSVSVIESYQNCIWHFLEIHNPYPHGSKKSYITKLTQISVSQTSLTMKTFIQYTTC